MREKPLARRLRFATMSVTVFHAVNLCVELFDPPPFVPRTVVKLIQMPLRA